LSICASVTTTIIDFGQAADFGTVDNPDAEGSKTADVRRKDQECLIERNERGP
jgi:hypothetical protein